MSKKSSSVPATTLIQKPLAWLRSLGQPNTMALILAVSFLLGATASYLDVLPTWLFPHSPSWIKSLGIIANSAAIWTVAAFAAAKLSRTAAGAYLAAAASLILILAGYYLFGLTLGDRQQLLINDVTAILSFWLLFAIAAAIVFGRAGFASNSQNWPYAVLGSVFIVESNLRLWQNRSYLGNDPYFTTGWACIMALGVAFVILAYIRFRRHHATAPKRHK